MITILKKAEKCKTCGKVLFREEHIVVCDHCEKDITELYNKGRSLNTDILFYQPDNTIRLNFCNVEHCFKHLLNSNYNITSERGFISLGYFSNNHYKEFKEKVKIKE